MNNYEAPTIVKIGEARNLILGTKPQLIDNTDSEFIDDRAERVLDIDETDE
jgi:hypothetical protein